MSRRIPGYLKHSSGQALFRLSPDPLQHTRAIEVRAELGSEAARTVLGHATNIT